MKTWCEAQAKYTKENGLKQKKVKGVYLVEADCMTVAESTVVKQVTPLSSNGGVSVISIKKVKYDDVFQSEAGKWFKVKYHTIETKYGKKGKETKKKTTFYALVAGDSTKDAEDRFHASMKGTMFEYTVDSVSDSNLSDVFPYVQEKQTDETR